MIHEKKVLSCSEDRVDSRIDFSFIRKGLIAFREYLSLIGNKLLAV